MFPLRVKHSFSLEMAAGVITHNLQIFRTHGQHNVSLVFLVLILSWQSHLSMSWTVVPIIVRCY